MTRSRANTICAAPRTRTAAADLGPQHFLVLSTRPNCPPRWHVVNGQNILLAPAGLILIFV